MAPESQSTPSPISKPSAPAADATVRPWRGGLTLLGVVLLFAAHPLTWGRPEPGLWFAPAGLAVAELRVSDAIRALDPHHRVHATLRAVELVRSRLAAAT